MLFSELHTKHQHGLMQGAVPELTAVGCTTFFAPLTTWKIALRRIRDSRISSFRLISSELNLNTI